MLLEFCLKKDLRVGYLAMDAMRDLLVHNILPDRPLVSMDNQLLTHPDMTLQTGLLYWFEHQIKDRMVKLVDGLEAALQNNVAHFRVQGLEIALELLLNKPEQEARLLEIIVNKMGDSDGKVNSKACDQLQKLLSEHPAMKLVIIRELRHFITRSSNKTASVIRAVNFLAKIQCRRGEKEAVLLLAECYLGLFEQALTAGETGNRLLAILLSGINRLFYLLTDVEPLLKYLDPIFRLVHSASTASWTTATQALTLLANFVIAAENNEAEGEAQVKQAGDDKEPTQSKQQLADRYYKALYAALLTDQAIESRKEKDFLNLLFRSVKADRSVPRAMAFAKRIAINATLAAPPISAAYLYLLSEIIQARPALKDMLMNAEIAAPSDSMAERDDASTIATDTDQHLMGAYDAMKRDPRYACLIPSHAPSLYELALLQHSFHPSVQAFATALLEPPSHGIAYSGDALEEFSFMAFLNRFAYKNPKQKVVEGLKTKARSSSKDDEEPVNISFRHALKDTRQDVIVPPEKHFFYKFFGEREVLRSKGRSRRDAHRPKGQSSANDDDESEDGALGKGDDDNDDDDEEAEIDAFADELAEGLMRNDAAGRGEFFDDDDDDDDIEDDDNGDDFNPNAMDDDDDGDFDLQAEAFDADEMQHILYKKKAPKKTPKAQKRPIDDDSDDDDQDDDNFLDFQDFSKKQHGQSMDDDSQDDELPPAVDKQSKKKRKTSVKGGDDDFAEASAYEEQMEENVERYAYKGVADVAPKATLESKIKPEASIPQRNFGHKGKSRR